MNRTDPDPEVQRARRLVNEHQSWAADFILGEKSLIERIEADALLEDGVATSAEIYEGLGLERLEAGGV
jgi:hypothetical protein